MVGKEIGSPQPENSDAQVERFQSAKKRVEASETLASQLGRPGDYIKRHEFKRSREARNAIKVDARNHMLDRTEKVHVDPQSGESITEKLVSFVRSGDDGKQKTLEIEDKKLVLNGDLYDAKVYVGWREYPDGITRFVPIVNSEGEIQYVVALTEKYPPGSR